MSENNNESSPAAPKRVIKYHNPVVASTASDLVTFIGAGRGADNKYGIVFLIPTTDDEATARYNCSLADLIRMGVQKISTSPQYSTVMFKDGELIDGGHEAGQALANKYQIGVRGSGGGGVTKAVLAKKAKAAESVATALAAAAGMSLEDVKKMIEDAQAVDDVPAVEEDGSTE